MDPMIVLLLVSIAFAIILVIQTFRTRSNASAEEKVLKGYFLLGLSGLMAKIAIADGKVTNSEAEMSSRFFNHMDLTDSERAMCLGNFITARKDGLSARDHAKRFMAYANPVACEFLYDMLWRISRIDGEVAASEDALLRQIADFLGLGERTYENFKAGKKPHYSKADLHAAGVPATLVALAH